MATHVPAHSELVSWIDTFETMSLDERHVPIDAETLATCLEMSVNGATLDEVRAWMRVSSATFAAADMIPPSDITFIAGPNIGAWPATAQITRIAIRLDGVEVDFTRRDGPSRWPDVRTPGWTGDLQYSLGMCLRIDGRWFASAPIETWHGNNVTGGPIQSTNVDGSGIGQIPKNWFYDGRWAPMNGYQPKAGESIGLFVCAGDARNGFSPLQERSNIALVRLPADGETATFTWTGASTQLSGARLRSEEPTIV
jgi:hypothetical protein